MRMLIQRVSRASVTVAGQTVGQIGHGLLVLVGVEAADDESDIEYLSSKLVGMRIFADSEGKMNLNIQSTAGEVLVVSQFTLHASTKKGNRPSFIRAAPPEQAEALYERLKSRIAELLGRAVESGQFAADMAVELVNDGPVTIWMDSKSRE